MAVTSASAKIGELSEALRARDAAIERLHLDLVAATVDAGSSRDRADKLEARFMQVQRDTAFTIRSTSNVTPGGTWCIDPTVCFCSRNCASPLSDHHQGC